ncbi:multicopper oxidase family protein, partial [Actinophytocola sp.]|uniref:multicopper oxidase family protein n=1 Tax=Actinophytocola sp. TaxID=1872138 RepID=UPI00389ACB19
MTNVLSQPSTTVPALAPGDGPNYGLTKFLDPLRIPPVLRPHSWWHQEDITVNLARAGVRLHSQLPVTTVWAYEGQFPGPTIEVRSGKKLRVAWSNDIEGTIPLVAVTAPPQEANKPGSRDANGNPWPAIAGVADLPAWTVVHLHGALTNGGNDGWAHNATLRKRAQLTEYPNEQQSTTLWYHDHAMAVTRFNVHAGLAGMYIVRDDEEDGLGLPAMDHEIPLIITDRNLDTDPETGALNGQLLFKPAEVAPGVVIPFTGPFTLVNGVIWPHLDVDARWYRFRVLNASNSRFYRLNLVDEDGNPQNDAVRIIGTDGGLLPAPAPVPVARQTPVSTPGGLVLAPAERVDLLIDFSRFKGQRPRLTNGNPGQGVEPDVMEFRVENRDRHESFVLPAKLSESYVRLAHGTTVPEDHDHVFAALVPPGSAGEAHPQIWELAEITDTDEVPTQFPAEGVLQVTDPANGAVRTFRRVATIFDDTTTFFLDHGRWAVWNFLHFGGPTHPMHIHMAQFQLLTRRQFPLTAGAVTGFDVAVGGTTAPVAVPGAGRAIEQYEEGWKDTFQVQAGEWITVAGHFAGATGEFMYHCHILDHE